MWFAFGLAVSVWVTSETPPAAEASHRFEWESPAQCPSAAEVEASVEQHLGHPLDALPSDWSVVGSLVAEADGGWSLALVIETPDGHHHRPLTDPSDCFAVADAAAVLIALALDPQSDVADEDAEPNPVADPTPPVVQPVDEPQAAPQAPSEPEDEPEPAPEPPIEPETRGRAASGNASALPVRFAVGAAGGLDFGVLPKVAPMGHVSFSLLRPRVRAGVSGAFGISQDDVLIPDLATATSWVWNVGVEAGPVFDLGSFEIWLMVGAEAGALVVQPSGIPEDNQRRRAPWAAGSLSPALAWVPIPALAVVLRAGGAVALTRPTFSVDGEVVYEPNPAAIRASLGIEGRFP